MTKKEKAFLLAQFEKVGMAGYSRFATDRAKCALDVVSAICNELLGEDEDYRKAIRKAITFAENSDESYMQSKFDEINAKERNKIKKGDKVYTPRFCTVTIKEVFPSRREAKQSGYEENTCYENPEYVVLGKSLDMYHMEFAAAKI